MGAVQQTAVAAVSRCAPHNMEGYGMRGQYREPSVGFHPHTITAKRVGDTAAVGKGYGTTTTTRPKADRAG